ncbi:MAG: ACP S-malonyltransferase [Chloroflexaceae bacterium]
MTAYAILFPGQGSQFVGMGKALAATSPVAATVFADADAVLKAGLSTLCFNGPELELNDTANAQPAIFVTSIAAWKTLSEAVAMPPAAVAGHSLGLYSALVAAGALHFADALRLVQARGLAMKAAGELAPGGMIAVLGQSRDTVSQLCARAAQLTDAVITIANDNCPGQIVVAGDRRALEVFAVLVQEQPGALPPTPLKVSVAPHTPLMQPAMGRFLEVLAATPIAAPAIPVLGNVSADWLTSAEAVRQELSEQLTHEVRWVDSMRRLVETGITTVVEVGPGKVLTGLMRAIDRRVGRMNFGDNPATLPELVDALQAA